MEQQRFNIKETAKILGCSTITIKRYTDEGVLRKLPAFDETYFSKSELERVLSSKGEIKTLNEIQLEEQVRKLYEENQNLRTKLSKIATIAI